MSSRNDAIINQDGMMEDLYDNEIERLEYQDECVKEGKYAVRLTERQLWFLKCAVEAATVVLPIKETQLSPETFKEDYGVPQKDIIREIERLRIKLKAL